MSLSLSREQPKSKYSSAMQNRIKNAINSVSQLRQATKTEIKIFFRSLVSSQQFTEWIILKEILQNQQVLKILPSIKREFADCIQDLINEDQTIVMKIFLYGWISKNQVRAYVSSWSRSIRSLVQEGKVFMFSSWLTECNQWNNQQTIQTIDMLVQYFPIMVKKERVSINAEQLQFILLLLCHYDLKRQQQFEFLDNLIMLTKQFRLGGFGSYKERDGMMGRNQNKYEMEKQQHTVLKILLNILANSKHVRGNIGWIFFPQYLPIPQIKTFFYFQAEQLLSYSQDQLVRIFSSIFQNSLQESALVLFQELSFVLKEQQKYYELKILYQKIVLPILARRGKARINFTEIVLQICLFYIIGFYQHLDIGKNGLICILHNIQKIQEQKVRNKWAQIALLLVNKECGQQFKKMVCSALQRQNFPPKFIQKIDQQKDFSHFIQYTIWQISLRNSKKLKIYSKNKSKQFKGIQNRSMECYIISVLQALYTTRELPKILKEYNTYKRQEVCYNLKQLFESLGSKSSSFISQSLTVQKVKQNGPEYFSQSLGQQDTQQYFVKLFQKIEQQLTKNKQHLLLQQLQKAFKSKIHRRLQCQNPSCKHVLQRTQEQFIHTIPNRSTLKQQQVQQLTDYKCQKCQKKKFIDRIKLDLTSKILVVHINRFSYKHQKSRKQLATQNIKRQFLGYRLKGILFHIGKNVQCGHYVYYFNVEGKKWIEMNDSVVNEFMLETQDEEFQSQMKAQMTPYLLFYVKK